MENNWAFVIAAYTVTWVVIIGYTVYVHRTLTRARAAFEQATLHASQERRP